jgi:hypothetical protein
LKVEPSRFLMHDPRVPRRRFFRGVNSTRSLFVASDFLIVDTARP